MSTSLPMLRRLNLQIDFDNAEPGLAADVIYLLAKTFHSSWYETMDGGISLSPARASGRSSLGFSASWPHPMS